MMLRRYHQQEQKINQPVNEKPADSIIPAAIKENNIPVNEKPKRGRRKKDDVQ